MSPHMDKVLASLPTDMWVIPAAIQSVVGFKPSEALGALVAKRLVDRREVPRDSPKRAMGAIFEYRRIV